MSEKKKSTPWLKMGDTYDPYWTDNGTDLRHTDESLNEIALKNAQESRQWRESDNDLYAKSRAAETHALAQSARAAAKYYQKHKGWKPNGDK